MKIVKKLTRLLWVAGLCTLDYLTILTSRRTHSIGLLLVRLDAIGDFVLWLDSAKEYRRLFPKQKITLIANSAWVDLARDLPHWDEVWAVDLHRFTRHPLYRSKMLRQVCQANFAVAIHPTFSRTLLHGDSVIRASRAIQRIGSIGDFSNISAHDKAIGDRWYNRLLPASPLPMMELQRNAEFIRHLTGNEFNASIPKLPEFAKLQPQGAYFILFPGASWHGRQWPTQRFAQVLEQIHRHYQWQAVLCGSSAENVLCQAIADESQVACLNLSGQTTLADLAELIRSAQLLIGNETSAVHLAAAVGTPAVCIMGGGHFGRFMPYPDPMKGLKPLVAAHQMSCFNCNWRCSQPHDPAGPMPCIAAVTVKVVLERAQQALDSALSKDANVPTLELRQN